MAGAAALAACGGGGGGGGGSTGGGGGGGGTTATSYYLSGGAGTVPTNPTYQTDTLEWVDTKNLPSFSALASAGTWNPQATIAEWSVSSGTATSAGVRYRVYEDASGNLQRVDLAYSGSGPTMAQLSTFTAASVCPSQTPLVLNDYAMPANSLLVYRATGCGTFTDTFITVPLSAGASTAPSTASNIEPIDAVRDATGSITHLLVIVHNGSSATVAYTASASITSAQTSIGTLLGAGFTLPGSGDFQSLGVVLQTDGSAVWLYRDFNTIFGVHIGTSTAAAPIAVFPASDTDTPQAPVIIHGTDVYVAMTDTTNNVATPPAVAYTCQIVHINTASIAPNSGQIIVQEDVPNTGIYMVGLLGSNVLYAYADYTSLRSVPTSGIGLTSSTAVFGPTSGQTLDTGSSAVVVGSGVYFTVVGGSPASQTYFYSGSGAPVAVAGTYGGEIVGGVSASPMPAVVGGIPIYGSAVIAQFAASTTALSPFDSATFLGFGSAGTATTTYGAIQPQQGVFYSTATLSEGPLQAGVPALISVSGSNSHGNPSNDLYALTPGTASSLVQVTTTLQ